MPQDKRTDEVAGVDIQHRPQTKAARGLRGATWYGPEYIREPGSDVDRPVMRHRSAAEYAQQRRMDESLRRKSRRN